MNYEQRVQEIRNRAEGSPYFDYHGKPGNYYGYLGGAEQYFGYNQQAGELPAYGSVLTVQVSNSTTAVVSNVDLFNAIEDPTDANLSGSITITIVQGSTHVRIKSEIISNPWWIENMKVRVVTAATQFDNALTLRRLEGTGEVNSAIWDLTAGLSSIQFQALRVEHPNFRFKLDGYNGIRFNLNGSEVITFTFGLRKKVRTANLGTGANPTQMSDVQLPTGDPRYDTQFGAR